MTRARSLSQLANSNVFTVDSTNSRVGIGSTIPDVKLDVDGNMNVSGTLTYEDVTNVETAGITTTGGLVVTGLGATIGGITTFFGDLNFGGAGVGGTVTTLGHGGFTGIVTALGFQATGVITATSFRGDGSQLSGVDSSNLVDSGSTNRVAANTSGIVVTGIATVTSKVKLPDNGKFTAGAGDDSQIYHNGTDSYVQDAGTGSLILSGSRVIVKNAADNEKMIDATEDGAVELYHDNTKKFETASAGVAIHEDTDKVVRFTGAIGEIGNVTGFQATNTAASALTAFGIRATDIRFAAGSSESARIDSSGRLLIGTTSEINSSTASNFQIANASGPRLCIARNDTSTASGNLIGALDFYGNDSDGTYELCGRILAEADADHTTDSKLTRLTFYTAGSDPDVAEERLRIDSSGNVNIGPAAAPRKRLDITGPDGRSGASPGNSDTALIIDNNSGNGAIMEFLSDNNAFGRIFFTDTDASNRGQIVYEHSGDAFQFSTAGSERVRINSSGHITPGADATQNLGSTSKRWANIYSADLQLSNEGAANDVDGTWGNYTIQEGEDDLFLLNRRSGKKYRFMLEEV